MKAYNVLFHRSSTYTEQTMVTVEAESRQKAETLARREVLNSDVEWYPYEGNKDGTLEPVIASTEEVVDLDEIIETS